MNALFLKDLADKTRRGHVGRVKAGRVPGSLMYGYEVVRADDERGLRQIDPMKAEVIKRIFRDYAVGLSPMAIAAALNAEGIPAPRGGRWNGSTIVGTHRRQAGIINNRNYIGRIIYNKQRMIKDPDTGRRQARINDPAQWIEQDAPELAIVPIELFEAAQARRAAVSRLGLERRARPKHLLSGLVRCGVCGGNMIVAQHDRLGCSTRKNKGACDNQRTVRTDEIEQRVLAALHAHLLAPERVAEFVEIYRRERTRLARERANNRSAVDKELAEIERKLARLVRMIEDGEGDARTLMQRIKELEARQDKLAAQKPQRSNLDFVEMHPQAVERYRKIVATIQDTLKAGNAAGAQAMGLVRQLIDRIVVKPTSGRAPVQLDIIGDLALLLSAERPENLLPIDVVAGGGLEPPTYGL